MNKNKQFAFIMSILGALCLIVHTFIKDDQLYWAMVYCLLYAIYFKID